MHLLMNRILSNMKAHHTSLLCSMAHFGFSLLVVLIIECSTLQRSLDYQQRCMA